VKQKLVLYSCLLFLVFSCDEEKIKKQDYDSLVTQEINSISFDEVDIYPNFSNCQTNEDAAATKLCFVETLHSHLKPFFEVYQKEHKLRNDSIFLKVRISNKGNLRIVNVQSKKIDSLNSFQENLNSYLQKELPKIHPAQKQGIPIQCSFVLPIIITSEI